MTDPVIIHQLSLAICDAIEQVQQRRPELLNEKYRSLPLQEGVHKISIANRLAQRLNKAANLTELLPELNAIMRLLISPSYLGSQDWHPFFEHIPSLVPASLPPLHAEAPQQPRIDNAPEAIAILLLDAENLRIDDQIESFLATACTYPLHVKIAFANWRSLGNYDVELHHRHYDLIHVPKGKDMADGKMIVFGASLHERYPEAKEVVVCSSDTVMSNLCTKLRQEGFLVSRVQKEGDYILFSNTTGKTVKLSRNQPEPLSLVDYIRSIQQLIRAEQQQTGMVWIPLARISKQFSQAQGMTLSEMMRIQCPGKRARDLFTDHPHAFVIHQAAENTELYVSVFDQGNPSEPGASVSSGMATPATAIAKATMPLPSVESQPPKIFRSRTELETAITQLVLDLTVSSDSAKVDIAKIGSQFAVQYQQPITAVLKQLKPSQRFLPFLQSCQSLTVEPSDKGWQVQRKS